MYQLNSYLIIAEMQSIHFPRTVTSSGLAGATERDSQGRNPEARATVGVLVDDVCGALVPAFAVAP